MPQAAAALPFLVAKRRLHHNESEMHCADGDAASYQIQLHQQKDRDRARERDKDRHTHTESQSKSSAVATRSECAVSLWSETCVECKRRRVIDCNIDLCHMPQEATERGWLIWHLTLIGKKSVTNNLHAALMNYVNVTDTQIHAQCMCTCVCVCVVCITCVWACQCQRSANEGRLRCGCCCFLFTCSFICLRRILLTAHTHTRILIHIVSLCSSLLNESLCVIGSITWPQLDIETGATHSHCGRAKVDKHTDLMIQLLSGNSNFNRIVYLILRSF